MQQALVGVIGGSGLYQMDALQDAQELDLDTPYGKPSDMLVSGTLQGVAVVFLARHGRGHRLIPSEVPYRANVYALKQLGVRYVISMSAVGSLREELPPLDMVLPDQFIDLTKRRDSTFFGAGAVAHASLAQPVCAALSDVLARAVGDAELSEPITLHRGGSYVWIEGPQFSTFAESRLYRSWGMDVIGMTNLQEAKLAREAEICYATIALVTDYDCWHPDHDSVTVDLIIATLLQNAVTAQKTIAEAVDRITGPRMCACKDALAMAIITQAPLVPEQTKKDLSPIIGKYMK